MRPGLGRTFAGKKTRLDYFISFLLLSRTMAATANLNAKTTIYVSGLDNLVTEQILHSAFLTFGDIISVQIPPDQRNPGQHRGFAFVEFELPEDAAAAIENMHLSEMFGKVIRVSLARPGKTGPAFFSLKPIWAEEAWLSANAAGGPEGEGEDSMDIDGQGAASSSSAGPKDSAVARPAETNGNEAGASTGAKSYKVYMDISIGGTPAGRLILQLRPDVCPKTSENFRWDEKMADTEFFSGNTRFPVSQGAMHS